MNKKKTKNRKNLQTTQRKNKNKNDVDYTTHKKQQE